MEHIIIDFEFTGLDNNYITDNEIVQMKGINLRTRNSLCEIYRTNKPSGAGAYLKHRIGLLEEEKTFNEEIFFQNIHKLLDVEYFGPYTLVGYAVKRDIEMIKKYSQTVPPFIDILDILHTSKYEEQIAKEGRSLETAYYIVTGKVPKHDHSGIEEVQLIAELFQAVKDEPRNEFMEFVPYGPYAGMPIEDFVLENRRMADGYRYNNEDLYSMSLNEAIYQTSGYL